MKTFFQTLALALALVTISAAPATAQKMDTGVQFAQAGLGFGGWASYTNQTPIISLSYMHGIDNDFLNGRLAVGGTVGYKSATYGWSSYDWRYTYTYVAGRATWHPNFIKSERFDAYAGVSLGMLMVKFDSTDDFYDDVDTSGSSMVFSGLIGARYAFSDKIGAYMELGSNLGYATVGVSVQL